jgi:ribonuclease P protein component
MLAQINRIRKKNDFDEIFKKAKSFKHSLFIFKIIENDLGINRFGFVVSQKVSKNATVRNKVKRRLSEAVKNETQTTATGADMVFITLPRIATAQFSEIKRGVAETLSKFKINQ